MEKRLRIAWFSPLTSGDATFESNAAYATAVLLPHVEASCEVELFHDEISTFENRPVHPHLAAFERHARNPFDLFFYQIENGRHSYFTRIHAALMPGIVWFHDFFLRDYGPEPILNSAWRDTVAKFHARSLQWVSHSAKHIPAGPLAFREAGLAAVKVFSSERDHNEYRRAISTSITSVEDRSYYLPLPVPVVESLRGAQSDAPIRVLFCGAPRIESKAHVVCETLAKMGDTHQLHWMVAADEADEARELVAEFGVPHTTLHVGRCATRWHALVRQSLAEGRVVAIHTLFSVFGQLAPYLNVSLVEGVPCVVCNFGQGELLPSSLVYKISCGERSGGELREVLAQHANFYESGLCERLSAYGRELFDSKSVSRELVALFHATQPTLGPVMKEWASYEGEARREVIREAHELARTNLDLPAPFGAVFEELGWV